MSRAVIHLSSVRPRGHGDVAINIRAVRGHVIHRRHFHHEIRLAQPPAGSELRRLRFLACAFRQVRFHPSLNQRNLRFGQPPFVAIRIRSRLRLPRRHDMRCGDLGNHLALLHHVLVRQQRKRRGLAGSVTRRAIAINDRSNIAVERHWSGDCGAVGRQWRCHEQRRKNSHASVMPRTRQNASRGRLVTVNALP